MTMESSPFHEVVLMQHLQNLCSEIKNFDQNTACMYYGLPALVDKLVPPPPPCESNTKVPKFDRNNTHCCSNKGVVCTRCEKTHEVTSRECTPPLV